ncbi:hypothetical protein CL622_04640 [archaeon]|nr:hypothetical protein [archaeon]|tara:strand:- start:876 stop:1988 length:1113 start_codon:yes stop_codon:yes gene_type:complete
MKKTLLVILDGAADSGFNTPLKVSNTKYLDLFACMANTGLVIPVGKGIAPESDSAIIALLGNRVEKVYTGRGILEAMGANVSFNPGTLLLRANIASSKGRRITNIEGHRLSKSELKKINNIHPDIRLIPTLGYRAVLRVKTGSASVSNSHPGYIRVLGSITSAQKIRGRILFRKRIKPLSKSGKKTADLLEWFSKESERILKNKTILLRGASTKPPKLIQHRDWACIADTPVEYGVAKCSGMSIIKPKKTLSQKASQVLRLLNRFNGVYIQLKDPDHFSHQGDRAGKIKSLEQIDRQFISKLHSLDLDKVSIIITSDHATPIKRRAHGVQPTPVLITGKKQDKVNTFSEVSCKKGFLGTVKGYDLLKQVS